MKGFFVFLVCLVLLSVVLSPVVAASEEIKVPNADKVSFETLSDDTSHIGVYTGQFCNKRVSWSESEKIDSILFGSPRVSTAFLRCEDSYLVLKAKPGYYWEYEVPRFFGDPGYILKRD